MEFFLKALISGILVASVSMMALRNATMAALLMGIPFTAFLCYDFYVVFRHRCRDFCKI